ncbi:hypothetical protein MATL_G00087320 [Megalops atlanticus]|uniref:Uncharacterized protein n=1 Tax=Megalops atlanticus TaxID=7932 RepID=A0A9D3Q8C0_MEGAT|nr:hypothetical protein MATL_G00087320 [Megalops atlanticus]
MRAEVKNKTDFSWHEGNSSQETLQEWPRASSPAAHGNGSTATPHPSHTNHTLTRGSGIVPGAIAAAVFIGFLLVLYALLWKCMVKAPRRKEKTKRSKGRDLKQLVC